MVSTSVRAPVKGPAARPVKPRWFERRVVVLAALIALAALALQWLIMPPPLYFDTYYVFEGAKRWPDIPLDEWPFAQEPHHIARVGMVLLAALMQQLFGEGQGAYFATAAVGGVLFFVGCYLVVRSLFGDVIGVLATLVLMAHPFFTLTNPFSEEVTWSTGVMLPDMPGAGLFAIGVAGLVVASRRTGRRQIYYLLAAGACMGSAYLAREFLAVLYLAIPVFFMLLRLPWRRLWAVAVPMMGVLAAELIHNAVVLGDPLFSLTTAAGHGGMPGDPMTRPLAFASFVRGMHMWHPLGWVFVALLALNVIGWAVTRDRRLALTLVWFGALWAPLTLQSGLLDPDDISLRAWLVRYWFAVFPALLAGGLGSVALLARRFRPGGIKPALAASLIGVTTAAYLLVAVFSVRDLPRDNAWSELRGWLKTRDDIPVIYSDQRLGETLSFYTRSVWGEPLWHGQVVMFPYEQPRLPPEAAGKPLLYTRWQGEELQMLGGQRVDETTGWRLLWRSSDGILQLWQQPR